MSDPGWGFASGFLAGQSEMQQIAQSKQNLALGQQEQELNTFKIAEAPLTLEKEKLALKIADQDFTQRQKIAEFMAKQPEPPPGQDPLLTTANDMITMSEQARKSGAIELSADYASKASKIYAEYEDAATKQLATAEQGAELYGKMTAGVHDKQSFDAANATYTMMFHKPSPLANIPWEQVVQQDLIRKLGEAHESQVNLAHQRLYQLQAERVTGQERLDAANADRAEAAAELSRKRAGDIEKAGGKPPTTPQITSAIADNLTSSSGEAMLPDQARDYARQLGPQVQQILKDQPGTTLAQAVHQAVHHARQSGQIPAATPLKDRRGTLPNNLLPMPKDQSQAKEGFWYNTPKGPMSFQQGKFYPPGEGPEDSEDE